MGTNENVIPIQIEDEMKESYITYAMSVIVSRALPDVRDGLKPVHRRILYAMHELSMTPDKPFKKSARVVGDVLGKYHPHGDMSIYNALVRLAQDFSMRYPVITGHGNFGSIDGDPPAAMRYTECRMANFAVELLQDLDKGTVDYQLNFDDTMDEPVVLPSVIPNLLMNGSSGIAVGMASNIPPHNLNEIIDVIDAYIEDKEIADEELIKYIKGPDFPTGGIIYGKEGIRKAYLTGRGKIKMRAKLDVDTLKSGKEAIIINEIPYQVNKKTLIEKIADLVKNKKLDGISNIRDESDRKHKVRVVIELKKNANVQVLINQLYKHTQLQDVFGIIMLALVDISKKDLPVLVEEELTLEALKQRYVDGDKSLLDGSPKVVPRIMTLKEVIVHYVRHRREIIIRRSLYELFKALYRAHILEGLLKAISNIDEVIKVIRASKSTEEARNSLIEIFDFSEDQAKEILNMRLSRLTALEHEKIVDERNKLLEKIDYLKALLKSEEQQYAKIKEEMALVKEKYADERKTDIVDSIDTIETEDLIPEEDMIVTISYGGYIKRLPANSYKNQKRGGVGVSGINVKNEDFVEHLIYASTHDYILFFSSAGRVFYLKVHELPEASKQARGKNIRLLLGLNSEENIKAYVCLREFNDTSYIIMATKNAVVKKCVTAAFQNARARGIIAINLDEGDELVQALLTTGNDDIMLCTKKGQGLRFNEKSIRSMGRAARGVRGIRLASDHKFIGNSQKIKLIYKKHEKVKPDSLIGMQIINDDNKLFVVTENGYGKTSLYKEFMPHGRGTAGQRYITLNAKTGTVASIHSVTNNDAVIIITSKGMIIKTEVQGISQIGRTASGVRLIRKKRSDFVQDAAVIVDDILNNNDEDENEQSEN